MSWISKKTRPIRHAVKYTPAFILSFIVPRSPRKWVFGSNMGFAGNAKYLFLYLASTPSEKITPLWIASSGKEYRLLKSMNINVARRWSLKGTWTALRSKYFVYNSYAPDVHLYAMGRAIKVNLWHGVGIKNIEYAISVGPMHDIFHSKSLSVRNKNRWFFIKPDIFLSTSPLMTAHFSRCFRIPAENCIESSYPRNAIFGYNREQILQIINENASEAMRRTIQRALEFKRIYVYMPTMRDSGSDFFSSIDFDFNKINSVLKASDSCMIIKTHPMTTLDLSGCNCSNILLVDRNADPYPLLALSDSLITDYSSVYYDYILMTGKEVLFLIPDIAEYLSADRDLAFPFDQMTAGKKLHSTAELIEHIASGATPRPDETNGNRAIAEKFWSAPDDSNHDLVNKILHHRPIGRHLWFLDFIRTPH